jgi:hypothetical protein
MQDINNEVNELSQLLVESDLWGNMLVISHTKLPQLHHLKSYRLGYPIFEINFLNNFGDCGSLKTPINLFIYNLS